MWYPYIILTRRVRIAIMCCLIASFCIISPLLILYTAGYRFDLRTRTIRETGVLAIDVVPKDAHVVVNDIDLSLSMPIRLANRTPGTYTVRITRQGYLPWMQSVDVESTQTTYLTNLYLFLDVLPTFEYSVSDPDTLLSFSPDASTALVSHLLPGEDTKELLLHHFATDTDTTLWRGSVDSTSTILWSHHAPHLAIVTEQNGRTTIETVDTSRPTPVSYSYTVTSTPPHLQWQEHGNDTLYVYQDDAIKKLSGGTVDTVMDTTSTIWFVDSSEDVWHIAPDQQLYKDNRLMTRILGPPSVTEIIDTRATNLIVKTTHGIGILWLDSGEITAVPGTQIIPRTYGKSWSTWIVWSPWEVSEILENGDSHLLTRTNEPIQDIASSPKHGTILFAFPHKIVAFHPEYRTTHVLFDNPAGKAIQQLSIDEQNTSIFFDSSLNDKQGIFRRML